MKIKYVKNVFRLLSKLDYLMEYLWFYKVIVVNDWFL